MTGLLSNGCDKRLFYSFEGEVFGLGWKEKALLMDEQAMRRAITRISFEIVEQNRGTDALCLIGVRRRGAVLAELVAEQIEKSEGARPPLGVLDITYYRDDRREKGTPDVGETEIGFDLNDKRVVLIDDVLFTGRTVRAAIDAIMDIGRPKSIGLAVLVDRGHRELPFRPDFVGKNVPTSRSEVVKVMVDEYDGCYRVAIGDACDC